MSVSTKPPQLRNADKYREDQADDKQNPWHQHRDLETVTSFKYLGSVITDEGSKPDILSRIAQTIAALSRLKAVGMIGVFLSVPRYD